MTPVQEIPAILERLARLHAARRRTDGLTDAQSVVLEYLSRANRFSRSPSAVADYLVTTRGTASQTLKSLAMKGLMVESAPAQDKRVRRYDLTKAGEDMVRKFVPDNWAATDLGLDLILAALRVLLRRNLDAHQGRAFGLCQRCRHHRRTGSERYCGLLKTALSAPEANQLCHEFAEPSPDLCECVA